MLNTIFYSVGFIFLILEVSTFLDGGKNLRDFINKFKRSKGQEKKKFIDENIGYIISVAYPIAIISVLYMLWSFIGLVLSAQRIYFGAIILLAILNYILPKKGWIKRLGSFIASLLLLTILFNNFN